MDACADFLERIVAVAVVADLRDFIQEMTFGGGHCFAIWKGRWTVVVVVIVSS